MHWHTKGASILTNYENGLLLFTALLRETSCFLQGFFFNQYQEEAENS